MNDAPATKVEQPPTNSEVYNKLSAASEVAPGSKLTTTTTGDTDSAKSTLPSLTIDGADSINTRMPSGAMSVAKDLGEGAWNEITQHPGEVALRAAEGLAIGAAVTLASPEIAAVAIGAGIGLAAGELIDHAPDWIHSAKVVDDQKDYTPTEVASANRDLQGVGAGGVELAAGMAGGLAGSYATSALLAGGADAVPLPKAPPANDAPPPDPSALPQPGDVPPPPSPIVPPATGDAPPAPASATPPGDGSAGQVPATTATAGDGSAGHAPATPTTPGDGSTTPAEVKDTPATPAALTPEQAVANSVKTTQALFNAADQDNPVITAGKQAYNVSFTKVTEPTQIQTLEGLKTGTTETVQPGQWIATRLDGNGNPVMENGIQNSWPMSEKSLLKTYQATPEDLQSGQLVAGTRTDAPPVHMIKLAAPLTIQTSWGSMSGEPGDWLANYDYSGGAPGQNYAIITANSFDQTYKTV